MEMKKRRQSTRKAKTEAKKRLDIGQKEQAPQLARQNTQMEIDDPRIETEIDIQKDRQISVSQIQEEQKMDVVQFQNPILNGNNQNLNDPSQSSNLSQQFGQQLQQQLQPNDHNNNIDINNNLQPNNCLSYPQSVFSKKIPNREALRDFFVNQAKKYTPSYRDLTAQFAKDVLGGKKKLIDLNQVMYVEEVPLYQELSAKSVWSMVKDNQELLIYFPDFKGNRIPQKTYLLNVLNTIQPGSVINAVRKLQEKRIQKEIDTCPVILTREYKQLIENFNQISSNSRISGLKTLRTKQYQTCCICLREIKRNGKNFRCNKHKGCKKCVNDYYRLRQSDQYKCPTRCL